jgi:hypothetical protein
MLPHSEGGRAESPVVLLGFAPWRGYLLGVRLLRGGRDRQLRGRGCARPQHGALSRCHGAAGHFRPRAVPAGPVEGRQAARARTLKAEGAATTFKASRCPLGVTAWYASQFRTVVLGHRGPLADAVAASVSVPGLFRPCKANGQRPLLDGALGDPTGLRDCPGLPPATGQFGFARRWGRPRSYPLKLLPQWHSHGRHGLSRALWHAKSGPRFPCKNSRACGDGGCTHRGSSRLGRDL